MDFIINVSLHVTLSRQSWSHQRASSIIVARISRPVFIAMSDPQPASPLQGHNDPMAGI